MRRSGIDGDHSYRALGERDETTDRCFMGNVVDVLNTRELHYLIVEFRFLRDA
jgi:hypothetical protein